jgi:hypothetical protein
MESSIMAYNNNDLFNNDKKNRPDRLSDLPQRPLPGPIDDSSPAQPWFVSQEDDKKKSKHSSKDIVKRVVSIVFPVVGLIIITAIVFFVITESMSFYA